jgi:hypothetical protein
MPKSPEIFLVTPRTLLRHFTRPEDRAYFAKPVRVEFVRKDPDTALVYVTDPARGHTYPVQPAHIKHEWQLTRRQVAASRAP